jgi:hypothetical protein
LGPWAIAHGEWFLHDPLRPLIVVYQPQKVEPAMLKWKSRKNAAAVVAMTAIYTVLAAPYKWR